ncbi:molybdate ABC transporter substrate-binding protein [Varunaivibrio sulfuroxidans]|uniref:Molybdate transport system substrate-binding protein n=1 Tax=Varunaivibrio sulfuroxidans TaxID=1773489 RepID=A0A4R3J7B7_9PROT|nr:molybdate ABC transporter substrate-binding protein [Varunaivibrio sulfuroxidans]TCS61758.1 molybdate transport system substrate-binding protein [Varunaivibrio sulfuroxidans]WES32058.1 molybdate ABC transporter substrate-binding protein [Varunaivibrio sulfuroxidans]
MKNLCVGLLVLTVLAFSGAPARAAVSVAVASNFLTPLKAIAKGFEAKTGIAVKISSGSTGSLYAQIAHGAPYDVFLAADAREPKRLEKDGRGVAGTRFTYALGKLALWGRMNEDPRTALLQGARGRLGNNFRLAVANPKTAPYGAAAMAVIKSLGLSPKHLVRGENIAQTFQFVWSGNAEMGFVALSQVAGVKLPGRIWTVSPKMYPPIRQQGILLHEDKDARAFLAYLKTDAAPVIAKYGYGREEP